MDQWQKIFKELKIVYNSDLNSSILEKIKFKEIVNDEKIILVAPDPFTSGWFIDNYLKYAEEISQKLFLKKYKFEVIVVQDEKVYKKVAANNQIQNEITINLNPKYIFERLVVGPHNDLAVAAALHVVDKPAKSYNPLFIHSDVTLGKTHILQAIAHKIIKEKPNIKVLYVTAENFTNEYIEALTKKELDKFRKKYRNIDVLLMDDIQFFQKKFNILEELFHTFNELFHKRKQLVFACDRPAKSLVEIEDRLRTRFESGLTVKIEAPNLETRKAILLKRAKEENIELSDDIVDYIASNIENDIRLLEGSLTKLMAYSELKKQKISLELAKEILKDKIKLDIPKNLSIVDILKAVSKYYDISVNDIKSNKRLENITYARQIAMYLAKEYTNLSLTEIGNFFGGKAHTTVMRSADKINNLLKERKKIQKELEEIVSLFYNRKDE